MTHESHELKTLDQTQKQSMLTPNDTQADAAWLLHAYMAAVTGMLWSPMAQQYCLR
jgi:hypothetical protein